MDTEDDKPLSPTVEEKEPLSETTVEVEKEKKVSVDPGKVEVRLQAVGDAPILRTKKFKVGKDKTVAYILTFVRSMLVKNKQLSNTDSLFIYVNQAFSPSPDQSVGNLNDCFGQPEDKLVLYYSRSQAYG